MKSGCLFMILCVLITCAIVIGCGGGGGGGGGTAAVLAPARCPEPGYVAFVSVPDPEVLAKFIADNPFVSVTTVDIDVYMIVNNHQSYEIPQEFVVIGNCVYTESGSAISL